jgi:hypothetical protein
VLGGLLALLILSPSQIWVALEMRFGDAAFGSATRINVPGPKVWATTLLQRPLGYRPEWLGVQGTWLTLLGLAAIFCVTWPKIDFDRRVERVRVIARWLPALLTGGFFGFLMNAEYLDAGDIAVGKYALLGIAGVELPCTLALMLFLAQVGLQVGRPTLARAFQRVAMAMATCMIGGVTMGLLAKGLEAERTGSLVQVWSALYGAACVITALLAIGAMLHLAIELFLIGIPVRWKRSSED